MGSLELDLYLSAGLKLTQRALWVGNPSPESIDHQQSQAFFDGHVRDVRLYDAASEETRILADFLGSPVQDDDPSLRLAFALDRPSSLSSSRATGFTNGVLLTAEAAAAIDKFQAKVRLSGSIKAGDEVSLFYTPAMSSALYRAATLGASGGAASPGLQAGGDGSYALRLRAVSGQAQFLDVARLDWGGDYSVQAWFKLEETPLVTQVLWDSVSASAVAASQSKARFTLSRDAAGRVILCVYDSQGTIVANARTQADALKAGQFHLVTLSQGVDSAPRLYIDDAQVMWDSTSKDSYTYTMSNNVSQAIAREQRDLRVGYARLNTPSLASLNGWVRGLVIRDQAQTGEQVRAQYEGAAFNAQDASIVTAYGLDQLSLVKSGEVGALGQVANDLANGFQTRTGQDALPIQNRGVLNLSVDASQDTTRYAPASAVLTAITVSDIAGQNPASFVTDRYGVNALRLSSSNGQSIQTPTMTFGGDLTLFAKFHLDEATASTSVLFDFAGVNGANRLVLYRTSDGRIAFRAYDIGDHRIAEAITAANAMEAGVWNTIALTLDDDDHLRLWVNGNRVDWLTDDKPAGYDLAQGINDITSLVKSVQRRGAIGNLVQTTPSDTITPLGFQGFGYVRDARVYNSAITPTEIAAASNGALPLGDESSIVAYYPLQQNFNSGLVRRQAATPASTTTLLRALVNDDTLRLDYSAALRQVSGQWSAKYVPSGLEARQGVSATISGFGYLLGSHGRDTFDIEDQANILQDQRIRFVQLGDGDDVRLNSDDTTGSLLVATAQYSTGYARINLRARSNTILKSARTVSDQDSLTSLLENPDRIVVGQGASLNATLGGYEELTVKGSDATVQGVIGDGVHKITLEQEASVQLAIKAQSSGKTVIKNLSQPATWGVTQLIQFDELLGSQVFAGLDAKGNMMFETRSQVMAVSGEVSTKQAQIQLLGNMNNAYMACDGLVARDITTQLSIAKLAEVLANTSFTTQLARQNPSNMITNGSNRLYSVAGIYSLSQSRSG